MQIHRFPLFVDGVLSEAARRVLGDVAGWCGQTFCLDCSAHGGPALVNVDLIGEHLFIPDDISGASLAAIERDMAPFVKTREQSQREFLKEVLFPVNGEDSTPAVGGSNAH